MVYVDDILVAAKDEKKIEAFKRKLSNKFDLKDLGPATYFLGIEFTQGNNVVKMCQQGYTQELLQKFGMSESNPVATPIETGVKLVKNQQPSEQDQKLPYRELVGALTYLSVTTRPDIAYSISYLGQFNNCYDSTHWKAAKRVLRYLKGTIDVGIIYRKQEEPVQGYVDADWGNCVIDRRSYSGYIFKLAGGPISWDSRKQRTSALSTTEAEYMALTEGVKEAIYLQRFLQELGFKDLSNLSVFCDNRSCLCLAENPTFHARTKHISIRYHFVRDILARNLFTIKYISTHNQVADFLTKGLTKMKHYQCLKSAGLSSVKY